MPSAATPATKDLHEITNIDVNLGNKSIKKNKSNKKRKRSNHGGGSIEK